MKKTLAFSFILAICLLSVFFSNKTQTETSIKPVSFNKVKLTDSFWAPRILLDKNVTIPHIINELKNTGRIKNFEIAGGLEQGKFCTLYPFDDSDVYKTIEAASYILQIYPDNKLEKYLDTLITYISDAQEKDGYLYTNRTIDPKHPHEWAGKSRWENVEELSHELYDAGHLYLAATAHYLATGKKNLLNIAIKNANLVDKVFGWGKLERVPGHEVIEMGLAELYKVTGDEKYLKLAKYFIDKRGTGENQKYGDYAQMNGPLIDQSEAVGHAVRAEYFYTGAADVDNMTGNDVYLPALERIWDNVVNKKLYITGGTGSAGEYEGFGPDYYLPNLSAYCETCASVGNVYWNYKMFLLTGDAKYMDVLERVIYNSLLSGISLSGDKFFYSNPLASLGNHERSSWFSCACCPPNIARTIPLIPGYVYATCNKGIYINLYVQDSAKIDYKGQQIQIKQFTDYPWDGNISLDINPEKPFEMTFLLRIPGWAMEKPVPGDLYHYKQKSSLQVKLFVNGIAIKIELQNGYAVIRRTWKSGDKISLELPMPVRVIEANDSVKADLNKVALEHGPIVFCSEGIDNPNSKTLNILIDKDSKLMTKFNPHLLNGVQTIEGIVKGTKKVSQNKIEAFQQKFRAIPYYVWANRGPQDMTVWFGEIQSATLPIPFPTIASTSIIKASLVTKNLKSINDQLEPANSNDHNFPYYHWWPKKDTTEWVEYDFPKEEIISSSKVYWFDDEPSGGECRLPDSYKLLYKSGNEWKPVINLSNYKIDKDKYDELKFEKVKTTAIRMEVTLQKNWSSGIHEWEIN
jgi:uncharacterized protein